MTRRVPKATACRLVYVCGAERACDCAFWRDGDEPCDFCVAGKCTHAAARRAARWQDVRAKA